jgi:hypothetical protein
MDFIPKKRDKEATLADPPILGPSKAEFVSDFRIAKALGLTIPLLLPGADISLLNRNEVEGALLRRNELGRSAAGSRRPGRPKGLASADHARSSAPANQGAFSSVRRSGGQAEHQLRSRRRFRPKYY